MLITLVNPRHKGKGVKNMAKRRKNAKRRGRRRYRRNPVAAMVPNRRRRRRSKGSSKRRRHYRSNPRMGGFLAPITNNLDLIGYGVGGFLAIEYLPGYVKQWTGFDFTKPDMMGFAGKTGVTLLLTVIAKQFIGTRAAAGIAIGGVTEIVVTAIKPMLPLPISGFAPVSQIIQSRNLGAMVSPNNVVNMAGAPGDSSSDRSRYAKGY